MSAMSPQAKLNTALLTPDELATPMGLGYLAAADRLGLIYLADTVAIAHLLSRFAEQAIQLSADREAGLLNVDQFDRALDDFVDRLAEILRGENPRYMAIPWFTDTHQLRQCILGAHSPAYSNDPESWARLQADPIREESLLFLTAVIEPEVFDYVELADFIAGFVHEILNIPCEVSLPFDVQFRPSSSISVIRKYQDIAEGRGDGKEN